MAGEDQLDELVARLRRLDGVSLDIATEARAEVLAIAQASASSGTTPDGEAWAPTKADGRGALPGAAGAVTAVVSGTTKALITLVLSGVYVFHQRSKSKGKKGLPRRGILPQLDKGDPLPDAMSKAIAAAAVRVRDRVMGGGK